MVKDGQIQDWQGGGPSTVLLFRYMVVSRGPTL